MWIVMPCLKNCCSARLWYRTSVYIGQCFDILLGICLIVLTQSACQLYTTTVYDSNCLHGCTTQISCFQGSISSAYSWDNLEWHKTYDSCNSFYCLKCVWYQSSWNSKFTPFSGSNMTLVQHKNGLKEHKCLHIVSVISEVNITSNHLKIKADSW